MASNIIPLDPVQGFVEYVQDVKPYHSKILEVLIEYIHTDVAQISITDSIDWKINISSPEITCANVSGEERLSAGFDNQTDYSLSTLTIPSDPGNLGLFRVTVNDVPAGINVTSPTTFSIISPLPINQGDIVIARVFDTGLVCPTICDMGFGSIPYGGGKGVPIIANDGIDKITIPGDVVLDFPNGTPVNLLSQIVNDTTQNVVGTDTNQYTIIASALISGSVGNPPSTSLTLSPALTPLLIPGAGETSSAILFYQPLPIVNVFLPSSSESAFNNVGSNMFVVDGLFTSRFQQGLQFEVDSGPNKGTYTVLYSDFVSGQTRIRVKETIIFPDIIGTVKPVVLNYDYSPLLCTLPNENFISVVIDEKLTFGGDVDPITNTPSGIVLTFYDDVLVYNLENTNSTGYDLDGFSDIITGFSQEPNTTYHRISDVNVDVVNNAFEISGGDFHHRFTPDLYINGYNISSPVPGNLLLGPFQPKRFPVEIDSTTPSFSVLGDLTWLYSPGRILTIDYLGNVPIDYTIGSSSFDGTKTTIIPSSPLQILSTNGFLIGSVYEPAPINLLGKQVTIVAVSPPADPSDNISNVESISYVRQGPLRINIETVSNDPCAIQITDASIIDFVDLDIFISSSLWDVAAWDEGAWDADLQVSSPRQVDTYQALAGETTFTLSSVVKNSNVTNVTYVLVNGISETFGLDTTGTVITLTNPVTVISPATTATVSVAYIV